MSVTVMGPDFSPIRRTIKNNNIFLVTDDNGNILSNNASGQGLYYDDTRFLSRLELKINNTYPITLSYSSETGFSSTIIGTNTPIKNLNPNSKYKKIGQETIQVKREGIIYGSYFETLTISNYNIFDIKLKLELFFEADFLDIFEVRNISTIKKGVKQEPANSNGNISFIYNDITGATLSTEVSFIEQKPSSYENGHIVFCINLKPSEQRIIKFQIKIKSTASFPSKQTAYDFEEAFNKATIEERKQIKRSTIFSSDNEDFNELLQRGFKDINMLLTKACYGEYIAAGIPWFTTLFGRDSIITARQCLILNSNIAKNVLHTLAKFQGKEVDDWKDEEPGKIPHEIRFGELARSNAVPHSTYYGSVDATALWLILFYEYFKWTNDIDTLDELWGNAIQCMDWIDRNLKIYGFAAYRKKSPKGLDNQGWKDSYNSNIHASGIFAEPPIALVEVQGYTYSAKMKFAALAAYRKDFALESKLKNEAQEFKERFQKHFWIEEMQYYALGLDKDNVPMCVITSNPGQCLETGIMDSYYAEIVAQRLFEPDMFSGWGIRTLSKTSQSYNPMSYHNGSVWPHDNSIIASGLAKIGRQDLALKITSSLFESARHIRYKRLPELFCGFSRVYKRPDPPVQYPVACSPQAWAASSIYMLIQSILNISVDAQILELRTTNPTLPDWVNFLKIENLKIGQSTIDLEFKKTSRGLVADILEKKGKIDIIIKK